jgi:hypothetical protein
MTLMAMNSVMMIFVNSNSIRSIKRCFQVNESSYSSKSCDSGLASISTMIGSQSRQSAMCGVCSVLRRLAITTHPYNLDNVVND